MVTDSHLATGIQLGTAQSFEHRNPTGFNNDDLSSMRLLDILIARERESYPNAPGSMVPVRIDAYLAARNLHRSLVARPLSHRSTTSRSAIAAHNHIIGTWEHPAGRPTEVSVPRRALFNFLLYVDPSIALRELQALHIYDTLAERFEGHRAVTAMDVKRTFIVLKLLKRSDAASGIDPFRNSGIDRDAINEAFDRTKQYNSLWGAATCEPPVIKIANFPVTHFTTAMALGALTMLPAL